ncbi:hypothetical protein NM688_g8841 [Phlebia brevispora]|uniref:Uncharacterized protein n=1 Tax=Phlebia brevispora TaxID=194682 RepID=A0ACC1RN12_9APHY|nr:hypothetical protein NM688_g8841 [Phlebia brevispora]
MSAPALTSSGTPGDSPHERLAFYISQLCAELDSPSCNATEKARQLARQARDVIEGYDPYVERMSSPHPPIIDTMFEEGYKCDWEALHREGKTMYRLIPEMSAGPYEGVVLQQLAKLTQVRTVLEIGMFTGTTTVSLALLPQIKKLVSLELEAYLKEHNTPFFEQANVSHKIDIRIGDALTSLDKLAQEGATFDMVFIDADKGNYVNYFKKVIDSNLLTEHGFIVADNTAYKGGPWAPDASYSQAPAIDAFNRAVREHPGVEVVMLPIRDGISIIRRKTG